MENIENRSSVRTYSNDLISPEVKEQLQDFIMKLEEKHGDKFRFPIIDGRDLSKKKIGTYGVIKGAQHFVCGIVKKDSSDLLELGYAFEEIILFATSLGLGTCWLGGTFDRSGFAMSAKVKEDESFIVASPIGYENTQKSLTEITMRKLAKSDSRKNWEKIFFNGSNSGALEKEDLGIFKDALEMVRIGPSASNKQPWRIVKNASRYDFFLERTPDYAKSLNFDIQMIDMGIAMCHFEYLVKAHNKKGQFEKLTVDQPSWDQGEYIVSWIDQE